MLRPLQYAATTTRQDLAAGWSLFLAAEQVGASLHSGRLSADVVGPDQLSEQLLRFYNEGPRKIEEPEEVNPFLDGEEEGQTEGGGGESAEGEEGNGEDLEDAVATMGDGKAYYT